MISRLARKESIHTLKIRRLIFAVYGIKLVRWIAVEKLHALKRQGAVDGGILTDKRTTTAVTEELYEGLTIKLFVERPLAAIWSSFTCESFGGSSATTKVGHMAEEATFFRPAGESAGNGPIAMKAT
ncbi:MAG: hypothetical protein A2Y63_01595 [Candidatus Riflebacteria bacterium RBG_13_59_9]|nr:MAG: hypothetical protein A2Y63_01595 [Candidatus Riflebacteria bacterium RBG_13_59_9]